MLTVPKQEDLYGKQRSSLRPDDHLHVNRPILSQPRFDETFGLRSPGQPLTPWQEMKRIGRKQWSRTMAANTCGLRCMYSHTSSWFPVLDWLPNYDLRRLLVPDLIAGLTVGVMNIPQGMAYALLAGLPPVCGLYTSFIPTLFYFAMGTSRQCSLGTFAVISMMTSSIVQNYAPGVSHDVESSTIGTTETSTEVDTGTPAVMFGSFTAEEMSRIKVGAAAALLTGIWQMIFGLLGFGALTVYLSDQLVQGFTCSAGFHVFSSQLTNVFGVQGLPEYHGLFKIGKTYYRFFEVIATAHPPTMLISLVTMSILIGIKYGINGNRKIKSIIKVPIPAELVVVIIGSAVSYSFNFEETYNVAIVKKVPRGMPPVTLPNFEVMSSILGETFALAVVTFAITVTLGMVFASKHNYTVSPNQEFKALGVGNIVGSWFQCFPSGASLARSAVQDDAGGRTQIVSLVQCVIVLVAILAIGPLLEPLPKPVLGSIVMVALFHLLEQVVELRRLWRLSFVDWTIFLVVFLAVLILDVDIGVGIGVAYAIMTVMFRLQKPKVRSLTRMPGTDIYRPTDVYTQGCPLPTVKIVRVDAPIYFANAAYIKSRLYNLAGLNNVMSELKKSQENTENTGPERYAFTNTLAMGDEMDQDPGTIAEQFKSDSVSRKVSRASAMNLTDVVIERAGLTEDDLQTDFEMNGLVQVDRNDLPEIHVILDCSEVCFVDVTGVSFLKKTATECKAIGVELLLANTNKPVRDVLAICGADKLIKPYQMFITIHDAVLYAINVQSISRSMLSKTLDERSIKKSNSRNDLTKL